MKREPTAEQVAMFTELGRTIEARPARARKAAAARKAPPARKAKRRVAG